LNWRLDAAGFSRCLFKALVAARHKQYSRDANSGLEFDMNYLAELQPAEAEGIAAHEWGHNILDDSKLLDHVPEKDKHVYGEFISDLFALAYTHKRFGENGVAQYFANERLFKQNTDPSSMEEHIRARRALLDLVRDAKKPIDWDELLAVAKEK